MESLSIEDDDLYEEQVVVQGRKTILQTSANVFLSGKGNLKPCKVYSNRMSDAFLQHLSTEVFPHTLTVTKAVTACKETRPSGIHGIFL